ncbi:endonuclease/exonuclease/phosphatase family protein [Mesorhizobium sp. LHD-90]|uniref:endonuclease/exonuclease/phosphatase family protein n=1 Tax=Mesorhizobium sp. LHD-90 TaxID=3071414 RepID=UPI0027E01E94|nr:endonuclease/exonuclease/phosphatase family protein [Mesorhizobium sp. LHD-90]MDQ6433037.1 endonuclease/exonuclease/phosphatase family protein [Mesorhizobium sp. LHD-90]
MRILSLNAWGGQQHADLLPFLATADADVVCLQEVPRAPGRTPDWLIYRDRSVELQQRSNLFAEIAAVLPDHDSAFFPTSRGELIGSDGPVWVEFGIATYLRKSLPVIGQAAGFVHGSFSPHAFGDHPRPRNAHCLRVFDYAAGHAVTIAHLHGLRTMDGKGDNAERDAQAAALASLIRSVWPGGERLVVCGDLNVLPGGGIFRVLGQFGLTDLVTSRGFSGTRTSLYRKPERFADYMFVTPDIRVLSFDVIRQPEVSDHCPLLLDLA